MVKGRFLFNSATQFAVCTLWRASTDSFGSNNRRDTSVIIVTATWDLGRIVTGLESFTVIKFSFFLPGSVSPGGSSDEKVTTTYDFL